MRHMVGATIAVAVMTAQALVAQTPTPRLNPTAPGTAGDPAWQATLQLSDGRTFVTDGGFAIDAAIAKPSTLPERKVPGKVLEDYFKATHKDECRLSDLTAANGRSYTTPSGIPLSSTYVNYLRRTVSRSARLRMNGPVQPIVVVEDGKAIAVLMAVAQ